MERSTRDEWAERVRRWRASGLTAFEFSQGEGLNANTLRWWASRLARSPQRARAFVEVALPAPASSAPDGVVEIVVRDGLRIRVTGAFDEEVLRRVLAVLEAR